MVLFLLPLLLIAIIILIIGQYHRMGPPLENPKVVGEIAEVPHSSRAGRACRGRHGRFLFRGSPGWEATDGGALGVRGVFFRWDFDGKMIYESNGGFY